MGCCSYVGKRSSVESVISASEGAVSATIGEVGGLEGSATWIILSVFMQLGLTFGAGVSKMYFGMMYAEQVCAILLRFIFIRHSRGLRFVASGRYFIAQFNTWGPLRPPSMAVPIL